jgi:tryptophanyl-tRNA synthetase
LLELILEEFSEARKSYAVLMNDFSAIDAVLKKGEDKARNIATGVLDRTRKALGY